MLTRNQWLGLGACLLLIWLGYALQPILAPFLIALFLAYLGDPLVDRLQTWRLSRTMAVTLVFVLLSLVLALVLLLVLPTLVRQVGHFMTQLPDTLDWLQDRILPLIAKTGFDVERLSLAEFKDVIQGHWQQAGNFMGRNLARVSASGLALVGWVANLLLIPVVTFYLLRDWDDMLSRLQGLLPRRWAARALTLAAECNEVLSAFIRGQLLVMFSLGAIYSLGLALAGLHLALLLGTLAGLASVVPYLGVAVGLVTAGLAAFLQFQEWTALLPVVGVFVFGQLLEGMVLTPLLVGDKIGLHPVAVIFAIMAGGQLAGFTGILIALPVAAVLMVLARHLLAGYRRSEFYGGGAATSTGHQAAPRGRGRNVARRG